MSLSERGEGGGAQRPGDGTGPARAPSRGASGAGGPVRPHILIVDDEPAILRSLHGLLRLEFEVHTAADGETALTVLLEAPVQVLLTDQRMPGMTGAELLAAARERHPDVVRLLFSGYADLAAVTDAINHGQIFRYITKPWDPEQLTEVLRTAAARHRYIVERRRLLYDLRRSHAQHMALFMALRERRFGALSELGSREATRLANNGRDLLDALDQLLKDAECGDFS